MPLVFTREEIQEYLSEMGYGELSEEDMEKFVKDLRKLVKNETKKRRRHRLGHAGLTTDYSTVDDSNSTRDSENVDYSHGPHPGGEQSARPRLISTPKSKQQAQKPRRVGDSTEFSAPDTTSESNNYKSTPTTEVSTTSTRTSRSNESLDRPTTDGGVEPSPPSRRVPFQDSNRMKQSEVDGMRRMEPVSERKGPSSSIKEAPRATAPVPVPREISDEDGPSGESSSSAGTMSDTDLLQLMEHILKTGLGDEGSGGTSEAGASKKKLEIPMKIRRDPVALYHWYKTFWDKQKPPGEDRHMQLRWNVRAGTIGRFPCDADGVPVHYLPIIPKQRKKIRAF